MKSDYHVVVVGGGIIGMTTALRLLQVGCQVTLLEERALGSGASFAANGALTPYSDHDLPALVVTMAERSVAMYDSHLLELHDLSGNRVDRDNVGTLEVFFSPGATEMLSEFRSMQAKRWPVEWITDDKLQGVEPALESALVGGVLYNNESSIDISQLLQTTERAVRKLGGTVSSPVGVYCVDYSSPERAHIQTTLGNISCDRVVLALGTGRCLVNGALTPEIRKIRGEILEVVGPPGLIRHCLYWGDVFITPRLDGRLLVGTSYVPHVEGMDLNTKTISVDSAVKQLSAAVQIVPTMAVCQLRNVWKSWRPASPDGLPIVGQISGSPVSLAMGLGGLGFTLAPLVAELIASGIVQGPTDGQEELASLSPDRFMTEV